jgi:hypothetical protein
VEAVWEGLKRRRHTGERERERGAPAGVPLHRSINTNDVTDLPHNMYENTSWKRDTRRFGFYIQLLKHQNGR